MPFTFSSVTEKIQRGSWSIIVPVLAAIGLMAISELAYQNQRQQVAQLQLMFEARLQLLEVMQRLTEAESGKRGYLLIESKEYLQPYYRSAEDLMARLTKLRQIDREIGDIETIALQNKIHTAIEAKLSEMREVMRLHDTGRRELALQIVKTGIGREMMQAINEDVHRLIKLRNQKIEGHLRDLNDLFFLGRVGILTMTVLSLVVLIALVQQSKVLRKEKENNVNLLRADRDALEKEVERRLEDLKSLNRHLQTVREDERARLARELHDELGALLTAAKLDVATMKPKLQKALPDLLPKLSHLNDALNGGIALKRRIIEDLSPSSLRTLGLVPALEILCTETAERSGIDIAHQLTPVSLPAEAQLTVYRFVQEAFTNMIKYAQAKRATVRLWAADSAVHIDVSDNGQGFDPGAAKLGAHGLKGMAFRIEAEGGRMHIDAAPGEGTRLTASIPMAEIAKATP